MSLQEKEDVPQEVEAAAAESKSEPEKQVEKEKQAEPEEQAPLEADEEEPNDGVPRVLVTGASGYIASLLTKCLLEDGRFRVRGTVRSKKNKEKVHYIPLPRIYASILSVTANTKMATKWQQNSTVP